MADDSLLTIFIAVVSVAVLIQAGIVVGLYFVTSKLQKQADRAFAHAPSLVGPLEGVIESLATISGRLAERSRGLRVIRG